MPGAGEKEGGRQEDSVRGRNRWMEAGREGKEGGREVFGNRSVYRVF